MSDRDPLGLSKLPQLAVPEGAWEALEARMDQRARGPQPWWPLAAAAVLVLSLGVTALLTDRVDSQQAELERWMSYSQMLEEQLQRAERVAPSYRGDQAVAINELQNMVAGVDYQLGMAAQRDERLRLWQQRVMLLNDMVGVHAIAASGEAQPLAYRGERPDAVPASYY